MIRDVDIKIKNMDTQIEIFMVEEKVSASMDEANYKSYLEQRNARDVPQGEGDLADLAIGVIDNACRDAECGDLDLPPAISPKGGGGPAERKPNRRKKK